VNEGVKLGVWLTVNEGVADADGVKLGVKDGVKDGVNETVCDAV
jgi:hypothetical protein